MKLGPIGRIGLIGLAAVALAGCGPDAKTEARLADMEKRQEDLRKSLADALSVLERMNMAGSNSAKVMADMNLRLSGIGELQDAQGAQLDALGELTIGLATEAEKKRTATVARAGVAVPPYRQNVAQRDGVPLPVYNQIATDARAKWANDFEMQSYEVKKQIEAYRKLHP